MKKLPSIFLPALVGISVYILVSKLFPEKVSEINSQKDLRGVDNVRENFFKEIFNKIIYDSGVKVALVSVFAIAGFQYFNKEIETILIDDVFNQICVKDVDGPLKVVCGIIKEHELNLHSKSIKELIVTSNLSNEEKINLLKIKLDFIINGQCAGKKRFLIISIIAMLIAVCVSGVGGLALFLEALYRLFQEGKLSQVLYEQILEIATKRSTKIPVDPLI
jgi:hypothetical protein